MFSLKNRFSCDSFYGLKKPANVLIIQTNSGSCCDQLSSVAGICGDNIPWVVAETFFVGRSATICFRNNLPHGQKIPRCANILAYIYMTSTSLLPSRKQTASVCWICSNRWAASCQPKCAWKLAEFAAGGRASQSKTYQQHPANKSVHTFRL
jgi:hypothetical protein